MILALLLAAMLNDMLPRREMDFSPYLLWLSVTLLFLCFLIFLTTMRYPGTSRLPPGPAPRPIVGSIFELGDMPHRSLARLANTYGPVMSLKLGQTTNIVVSTPDAAKQVLQKHDHSLSARSVPDAVKVFGEHEVSVIWMPPSRPWRTLRTVIKNHLFTPQRLDAGHSIRRSKVTQLIQHVGRRTGRTVDIGRAAFGTSLNLISNIFFSVDMVDLDSDSGRDGFRDLVWEIMEEAGRPNLADFFPVLTAVDPHGIRRRVTKHVEKLYRLLDEMIDKRLEEKSDLHKLCGKDDFLDELLGLELDRRSIRSLIADFFVAGSDTTSGTVEWAMGELLRNPRVMERAREELAAVIGQRGEVEESDISSLTFLQAIVKETFRLHPPVPLLLPHRAETEVEIYGYRVPKHSRVLVNVWAMGRDGNMWEDAERFAPERFLGSEVDYRGRHFELIPFGSGRRMCPGLLLAHRMVHLELASLLHSFEWKLPDGMEPADIDLTEKFGVTLALANPLPAVPLPVHRRD